MTREGEHRQSGAREVNGIGIESGKKRYRAEGVGENSRVGDGSENKGGGWELGRRRGNKGEPSVYKGK